ncbi:MAG: hypothetical protein WAZ34_06220 [Rhodocyclaceae bacterium]
MSISSIVSSGLQSMQASINRTESTSSRIAGFGLDTDTGNMAASMVGLRQGANDAKIAANVIKTGDELLGTLIDIRA